VVPVGTIYFLLSVPLGTIGGSNVLSSVEIFRIHLVEGFLACALFAGIYWWPVLARMDRRRALRQIAMLNAFRFEGLLFLMPSFVGPGLPAAFSIPAAYGDFATSLLAIASIVTYRWERASLVFTALYTMLGAADLINNIYHVVKLGILPENFGSTYVIPILYVPILLITHALTARLLLSRQASVDEAGQRIGGVAAAHS
jgi:hypothetical protein